MATSAGELKNCVKRGISRIWLLQLSLHVEYLYSRVSVLPAWLPYRFRYSSQAIWNPEAGFPEIYRKKSVCASN